MLLPHKMPHMEGEMKMKKHFVSFFSPGTFVAEQTTKPIDSWDVDRAIEMSKKIKERYGALPYGFSFSTRERNDDELDSHEIKRSNFFFLGGEIWTLKDLKKKNNPKDKTLIRNMEGNDWDKVVINNNSWSWTQPLEKDDVVLEHNPSASRVEPGGEGMREIKFRAWDGKRIHRVCRLGCYGFSHHIWSFDPVSPTSVFSKKVKIMQYTGLKDKNGKEIYEGDIVRQKADFGTNQYPDVRFIDEVVQFKGGAFYPVCNVPSQEFEIIGNVYENPELCNPSASRVEPRR